jgi:putative transposase
MPKEAKSTYKPDIHHRRSIRLKGYDYSQAGLYFITICTHERACLFGNIIHNTLSEMKLNDAGKFADECWRAIPQHFPNVILHAYIIMPNHIHGIIELNWNGMNVGSNNYSPQPPPQQPFASPSKTIGSVIRGFKIGVTKWFQQNTCIKSVWQRNYYEIIIRDAQSHQYITDYIISNPVKWKNDKFHTNSILNHP